jgi:hypothetical protein
MNESTNNKQRKTEEKETMKSITTKIKRLIAAGLILAGLAGTSSVRADTVTDWNAMLSAAINATTDLPPVAGRKAAIVQVAVFDAVNGIARKYEPYFVTDRAPGGARQEAAAAQAAYTTLVALFPPQKAKFDTQLAASLASIAGSEGNSRSIERGLAWGESVANAILAWRNTDGFSTVYPPYFGGTAIGQWRSVPDGIRPAILPSYRYMTPFALSSASQFRPGPPPDLTSAQYAADLNETKALGRNTGSTRTQRQTDLALLWAATAVAGENGIARSVLPEDASLVDNARLFALVNMAACDAFIVGFDCKYTYNFWRPYNAIRSADLDGNPDTTADPAWDSLVQPVPNHQEYISFHSVVSSAFMRVLAHLLGDNHSFTLTAPPLPGISRVYSSFSEAADEVTEARIWGGLHFRNSCNAGHRAGIALADYLTANFLLPIEEDGGKPASQELSSE